MQSSGNVAQIEGVEAIGDVMSTGNSTRAPAHAGNDLSFS